METYRTKDLYEASFLYATRIKLQGTEKIGSIVFFIFEDRETCESLCASYWDQSAQIQAKALFDAYRTLKDLIFRN